MTNPEVTTERTPGSISKSDLTTQLLAEIQAFLDRSGMAERTFGWKAVNDKRLVEVLRGGASVTLDTAEAVRTFMAKHTAEPGTDPTIARMLQAPANASGSSAAPFSLTAPEDCPAYRIGLRFRHWIDRDDVIARRTLDAIEILKEAMSFTQATSLPGAMVQTMVGADLLRDPIEHELSDDERKRCFEAGLRCIFAALRVLDQAGGVSRSALGFDYFFAESDNKLQIALGTPDIATSLSSNPNFAASFSQAIREPAPPKSPDADFLALAPKLLPMLDAFDRHWSQSKMMFAKVDAIFGENYTGSSLEGASKWAAQRGQSPEYQRYLEARQLAGDLEQAIEAMVDPFMGLPALTLDGLLLKRRVAQTLTQYSGDDSICQDLDGLLASRLEKGFLGTSAEKSGDPYNAEVFHVLNEHRAAARALEATINPSDRVFVRNHGGDASDGAMAPAIAANEAANERLAQAWRDIFKVRPRSLHGLLILLRHVAQHYDAHSTMVDEPDVFGALAGAVAGLRHAGMPEAQHDLSLLSIAELEALADVCRRQSEALTAVLCQPMCEKQGVTDYNSLGNIIDGEADRIGILGNDAEDEIERRKPSNDYERNLILKARIRSHLSGNGYIEPDLLAEAVAAWGG